MSVCVSSEEFEDCKLLAAALSRACHGLTLEQLAASGWLQYYLYSTLYAVDVEAPSGATAVKASVPIDFQRDLHLRWLTDILLKAQPQGSELLHTDVDHHLNLVLGEGGCLVNSSIGRPWDEQHCWFVGHLVKPMNLAIECDYLMPLGPGRPKTSGPLALKRRLMRSMGYHTATIHRCFWEPLAEAEKTEQLARLVESFRARQGLEASGRRGGPEERVGEPDDWKPASELGSKPKAAVDYPVETSSLNPDAISSSPPVVRGRHRSPFALRRVRSFETQGHLIRLKHKRLKFNTWPPEKLLYGMKGKK
eukprot:GHVT01098230.1.p1 GENE.GHVT01098230.1~~GHVT01098230.1.p1  ORF type:complete len:307 (+),score=68.46 GHVT01098230.1:857-1777(+)